MRTCTTKPGRARLVAACLLGLAAAGGCGEALPPPSEPDQARQALTAALDAWKRGETPDSLASAPDPVRILDREWEDGLALLDYELKGDGHQLGLSIQQAVALELETPKKRVVRKTVNYVVSAGSPPVVARQDIDE